jgi:small subunit ribosomal protein S8
MPSSKLKKAIAQVLRDEGYIDGFRRSRRNGQWSSGNRDFSSNIMPVNPVIERIERISKPGLRIYKGA